MATIQELFDSEFNHLSLIADWQAHSSENVETLQIRTKVLHDFEANARFVAIYMPPGVDLIRAAPSMVGLIDRATGFICMLIAMFHSTKETICVSIGNNMGSFLSLEIEFMPGNDQKPSNRLHSSHTIHETKNS